MSKFIIYYTIGFVNHPFEFTCEAETKDKAIEKYRIENGQLPIWGIYQLINERWEKI